MAVAAPRFGSSDEPIIPSASVSRRALGSLLGAGVVCLLGPSAARAAFPPGSAIGGELPDLSFRMTRSSDGRVVTAGAYRGKVVVTYFGFTRCPDTCPLTMYNLALILRRMGPLASRVRVLFITIDPGYDTVPRLRRYLAQFGPPPEIDGLRGTPAELAAMAKRYFVVYRAPSGPAAPDPVSAITHTSFVYVFESQGRAQDILATIGNADIDVAAMAEGLARLARAAG